MKLSVSILESGLTVKKKVKPDSRKDTVVLNPGTREMQHADRQDFGYGNDSGPNSPLL